MSANAKHPWRLLAAVALIVGAALVGRKVWHLTHVHGFIEALHAVDGDRAIVCVRANDEYGLGVRSWIGLIDAKKGFMWSERLPGEPASSAAHSGILVEDGVAFVRTEPTTDERGEGATKSTTSAWAVQDGTRLWSRSFTERGAAAHLDLVAAGSQVIQGFERSGGEHGEPIVSLRRSTGVIEWSAVVEGLVSLRAPRVDAGGLYLDDYSSSKLYPLDGAPGQAIPALGAVCVERDSVLYLARNGGKVQLVAMPANAPATARVVVAEVTAPKDAAPEAIRCGRFRGHLILTVRSPAIGASRGDVSLLELDTVQGIQVGIMPLDVDPIWDLLGDRTAEGFPEHAPLGGELPRFSPLFIGDKEGGKSRLLRIDLQEHRVILGPSTPFSNFAGRVQKHGNVFYVTVVDDVSILGRIDGTTGELTAAVKTSRLVDSKPFHVRAGAFWIHSASWRDALPYAVLDADTLMAKAESPLKVEDALAATKLAWFGPSP